MVTRGRLVAILLSQGIVSLSLRNTAFQDEALYLYAGRQIFSMLMGGPPVVAGYETYFTGLPYLYRCLGGCLIASVAWSWPARSAAPACCSLQALFTLSHRI